ncbi:MAG: cobyrinate a,c-diamide synthase [Nitratireductor sp.]|nr:cobyrinate a,c-diamide synthase [Nitratireductor sp.]
MNQAPPVSGLLIAAPQSGSGKTVLTLALLRALKNRGVDICGAKAGPDFIDPGFHALASGRQSFNLDPWAMPPNRLRMLARQQASSHLLVEGMMGLFDGAADGTGAAADLAQALDIPVLLIVDAQKQSHSIAALVRGFRDHRPGLHICGVILNRTGSERHEAMLREALAVLGMPVLGTVRRSDSLHLPERHLGLVQAGEIDGVSAFIEEAARLVSQSVDLDGVVDAFAPVAAAAGTVPAMVPPAGHVAIARDAAFTFLYPHQLDDWRRAGAEISFFSPLGDEVPDKSAGFVFLPGGYPELHAGQLAQAHRFKAALRDAASRNIPVHGECGGYMVLGEGIEDKDANRHEMCGLLQLETSFAKRKLHLGYRNVRGLAGRFAGRHFAAHEFHYSVALKEQGAALFSASDALGADLGPCGLVHQSVSGSYMHLIEERGVGA